MSKINLTPNASGTGTLTVTSPNTNTDYTLTLPSGTGTFNISGTPNEVPAGTASAPSIYFSGDTNTGIYSPAADTIAFTEGGVEAMRLDSSGNVLVGTTSASTPSSTGFISTANTFGFKNRIINGDMRIDQRNAGASVSVQTTTTYTLDRWYVLSAANSKYTVQQNNGSVTPPAGFSNYLGVSVGASAGVTVGATDQYLVRQLIEGFNVADLGFGTASAKTVTLSFWVRSSVTGTFGGALVNNAGDRSRPFNYTISSANTWEQKTVTITGDTTGTWVTNNGNGLNVSFSIGVGSTYSGTAGSWAGAYYASATGAVKLVETNSATWYITGVQLEVGTAATSFDYRPYGTELALCQRYYESLSVGTIATGWGADNSICSSQFYKVTKRATPTLATVSGTLSVYDSGGSPITSPTPSVNPGQYGNNVQGATPNVTPINTGRLVFFSFNASAEL